MTSVPVQLSLFSEKVCTKCKQTLPETDFAPRSDKPDKRLARCRRCQAAYHREYGKAHREDVNRNVRKFKETHPERVKEWGRKYREAHREQARAATRKCRIEHRDQYSEYAKQYDKTHREQRNARALRYARRHADRIREARRRWEEQHRAELTERQRPINQRRRARKRGNGGSFTREQWEQIKARYNWSCLCCGRREPDIVLHADHVVPIAMGGWNIASNLQPLCGRCNASKGAKFIDYRPDFYRI